MRQNMAAESTRSRVGVIGGSNGEEAGAVGG
jgi:hypothetical protein